MSYELMIQFSLNAQCPMPNSQLPIPNLIINSINLGSITPQLI
jgi:hypothetical protein